MNVVNSIRDGSFDKNVKDDTGHVSPDKWKEHFHNLLGPTIVSSQQEQDLNVCIEENIDTLSCELDRPFSQCELTAAVKSLKNNKSPSFDQVSNEMLKVSYPVIGSQLLSIFNTVFSTSILPSIWKDKILTPLHKSVSDPDNYQGIAVASCIYKLFRRPCKIWAPYGGHCVEKILAPKSKYVDTPKPGSINSLGHTIPMV